MDKEKAKKQNMQCKKEGKGKHELRVLRFVPNQKHGDPLTECAAEKTEKK